ncbi:MAG: hypothetical protein KDD47_17170, partial [Acidobacteria bacterium]|nr:hypothetical protein [Acidobacteriota bacterium]
MAKSTQTHIPAPQKKRSAELWTDFGSRIRDGRDRLLESPFFWVLLFLGVGLWILTPERPFRGFDAAEWQEGLIAGSDYEAPMDLPMEDVATTQEKRRKAREDVLQVYDFDSSLAQETVAKLGAVFQEGRRLLAATPDEVQQTGVVDPAISTALLALTDLKLRPEDITFLAGQAFSADLEDRLSSALSEVLMRGVVPNKDLLLENRVRGVTLVDVRSGVEERHFDLYDHLGYPEEVQAWLSSEVRSWPGLSSRSRKRAVEILFNNVVPNLNLNNSKTLTRKDDAAAAAEAVFIQIRRGQVLVRKGDQISATAARAIA